MSSFSRISVVVSIVLCSALVLRASTPAALTGSDNPGYSFGSGVAIDANTAAVVSNVGIYVFVKPASGWTSMTQTAKLTASDGASFTSVAISGNTIVAGSVSNGEAFVWVEPASGWTNKTETAKLTPSDGNSGDFFGASVAIAGDTAVVGASNTNSIGVAPLTPPTASGGAAYVFVKPAGGWVSTTETAELTASDGVAGDGLGFSVGINSGANTIIAGAPNATIDGNSYQGAVYVFVESGGQWVSATQTAKLNATYVPFVDVVGQSAAISGDTIVAGGYLLAFVWVKPAGGWTNMSTQTAQLTESKSHTNFGWAAAVSKNVIIIGAPGDSTDTATAADVYVKPSSGWVNKKENFSLHSPVDNGNGSFAWSVGVSGHKFIVGYPELFLINNPYGMVAYVY